MCANVSAIVVMSLCVHMCAWLIDVHAVCMISSDFHIFSIPSSKKWSGQCDEWVGEDGSGGVLYAAPAPTCQRSWLRMTGKAECIFMALKFSLHLVNTLEQQIHSLLTVWLSRIQSYNTAPIE